MSMVSTRKKIDKKSNTKKKGSRRERRKTLSQQKRNHQTYTRRKQKGGGDEEQLNIDLNNIVINDINEDYVKLSPYDKREFGKLLTKFKYSISSENGKFIKMLTVCETSPSHYFSIDGGITINNIKEDAKDEYQYLSILKNIIVEIMNKNKFYVYTGDKQNCIFTAIALILFPEHLSLKARTQPSHQPTNVKESIGEIKNILNEIDKLSELQELTEKSNKKSESLIEAIDKLNNDFNEKVKETSEKYNVNIQAKDDDLYIDVGENSGLNKEFEDEFNQPETEVTEYKTNNGEDRKIIKIKKTPQEILEDKYIKAYKECNELPDRQTKLKNGRDSCDSVYDLEKTDIFNKKLNCSKLSEIKKNSIKNMNECAFIQNRIHKQRHR